VVETVNEIGKKGLWKMTFSSEAAGREWEKGKGKKKGKLAG